MAKVKQPPAVESPRGIEVEDPGKARAAWGAASAR